MMDVQAILGAWRKLVPPEVLVSAGPLLPNPPELTQLERSSLGPVDAERLREFEAGRAYAKSALKMIGVHRAEVLIGSDRSPLWPAGITGSLTHVMGGDGGHFAAAVARTDAVRAVGIDVERQDGLNPKMWNYILTNRELERILALPLPARAPEVKVLWCAKEAVAKAAPQSFEPTELEIERDADGVEYKATCRSAVAGGPAQVWRGRTIQSEGFMLAAVVLR